MHATETRKDRSPRNGVDTPTLFATLDAIKGQPDLAKFQFRVSNRWVKGTNSRSRMEAFTGAGGQHEHKRVFEYDADHHAVLVGGDEGPTPVEFLLHGLAACITAGIANIAAARGVTLTEVNSRIEGDIDLLGHPRAVEGGPERLPEDPGHVRRQGRRPGREAARDRRPVPGPLRGVRRPHQRGPGRDRGECGLTPIEAAGRPRVGGAGRQPGRARSRRGGES